MAQQQEQDRTEPATPHKLKEAKQQGQVAKSMEVVSFAMLATALALAYAWGERVVSGELGLSRGVLSQAGSLVVEPASMMRLGSSVFSHLIGVFWLMLAAILVVAVLSSLLQTGPVLSGKPLKPDFERLNPAPNLKKLFSSKLLFELIKTIIKFLLFAGVIALTVQALFPVLISSLDKDPVSYGPMLLDLARSLVFKMLVVLLLVALADLLYTRFDYAKQMRMSRREVREEVKRREGDPLIRAKLRALQKEAAKRAESLGRVEDADVLITNPVHLAIALGYDRERMAAPVVLAKGADVHAARMRELARKHRVPIVQDRPLARALYRSARLDQPIPEDFYGPVAQVLAPLLRARARRATPVEAG